MKEVIVKITRAFDIEDLKSVILDEIKMDNPNVSYISDTDKILSPKKVKPYMEFDTRLNYFLKNQATKICLIVSVDNIKKLIHEDVKNKVYKTDPPKGFHFGMSNMEAQAYAPTFSEEDIREKELEISTESNRIYSDLKMSMLEIKNIYGIQIVFN
ncbi:hypothetical protein [Aquimarina algiphila]|uniref:hypothetical protein n=1 Tax=Aquimarina algiphila TaxID=2047982 RepID=UPI00232FFB76|nr:hypothetical protein [Aquimarina algiphila]